ncbi:MAG: hypothetical protein ABIQ38_02475 [Ilumatobacteraceae bacterium]
MRPVPKLGIFALGLVGAFALAAAAGASFGPIDVGAAESHATMPSGTSEVSTMSGMTIAADGYQLVTSTSSVEANTPANFTFRIERVDGSSVTKFDVLNERRLHLIVLSRDLVGYFHLHPSMDTDGSWRVELPPLTPNSYRLYADFQPTGAQRVTLATDLAVPGLVDLVKVPEPASRVEVDGYTVSLTAEQLLGESTLTFDISLAGESVVTDPYLGAAGHLVIIRVGDLGYLHAHAIDDADQSVRFMAEFPTSGTYRLFLEFEHAGKVRIASFTAEILQEGS